METGIIAIIIFLFGVLVGGPIFAWRIVRSATIGTLRVVDDGQEPNPYLFVELDKDPRTAFNGDYVTMKVRFERYSQE